jgi:hypothetical protein
LLALPAPGRLYDGDVRHDSLRRGKRREAIQEEILDELTSEAASVDEVDLARSDELIAERLSRLSYRV